MQTMFYNFFKIFFLTVIFLTQNLDSQAQRKIYLQADSLFLQRNFEAAQQKYEQFLENEKIINPNVFLKLAYIYENKQQFPQELYYLNLFYLRHPDERLFDKMNKIAEVNAFKGYERNDLNIIILLYKRFAIYILGGFLLLGVYIFGILVYKKIKNQQTQLRHKFIFILYLVLLATLINLPNNYRSVIIKNDKSFLRDYPSAAAPVVGQISEGHRLNVLDAEDIWFHVLWDGKLVYIKTSDVWLLK